MASYLRAVADSGHEEPTVLLVDEDTDLVGCLSDDLRNYGFSVKHAGSWVGMTECLQNYKVDLVLLEQRVGRIDMVVRLAEVQALTDAPMIFLSNNRLEADRILALELGAADFLLKPMSGREIIARVRAHLRRTSLSAPPAAETRSSWRIASTERRLYTPEGTLVPLTGAEFSLLDHLIKAAGQPVNRESLMQQVLRRPYRPEDRSIDNLIYQVRLKISGAGGGEPIVAMRGQGYAFSGFDGLRSASRHATETEIFSCPHDQMDC